MTFRELIEKQFYYDVFGLSNNDKKITKIDSLNDDEYNTFMVQNEKKLVNKYPTIKVVRSDKKEIYYDSVGDKLIKRK